ncbi:MAG: DNA repair protein RecN, partial [Syntrophomonadaceae bacterium]
AAKLLKGSNRLLELLFDSGDVPSAHDQLGAGLDEVMQLKGDSFFASLAEPLENIYYSLQDLSGRIAEFKGSLDFEPGELEEIENRLYLISRLKGKYGSGVEEILAHLDAVRREKEMLMESEDRLGQGQQELERIKADYLQQAEELSRWRHQAAAVLAARVHQELMDLSMPHISFEVRLSRKDIPGSRGIDDIGFWFSPNPGEEMKPVTRIASGGEISRFILALKTALADVYNIPTLIFDEIDVGLGGEALNSVARKLAELSRNHQLILVTHSPQVASFGDSNLMVEKIVDGGKTFTKVKHLDAEEKVVEIARMLAGDGYSQLTIEHAREMIASAQAQGRPS